MNGVPIGSKLPARRDAVAVTAAVANPKRSDWSDSINLTKANDRLTEFFDRNQGPHQVEQVLASALNGDLHYQSNLFIAMLDSWPKLQKNITEMARKVVVANWKVIPYSEPGGEPTAADLALAKDVEAMIWGMKPNAAHLERGFEGMVNALATAYYFGHGVEEINWYRAKDGMWKPRSTSRVPAKCYGYPYFIENEANQQDRLMFRPDGLGASKFVDFPPNKFLIGINCGHPGHPSMAAPLRALAFYWLAAVRGLKWMMQFTQRFGVPWVHATAPFEEKNKVAAALSTIGTEGYLVTEGGVTLTPLTAPQTGTSLPQRELMKLADQAADVFILGQTLTSGTDDSGSRALGDVHAKTQDEMVDAVADFVGEALTYQLVPAIVSVNYGERDDMPQIWTKREEQKDEKTAAEVMKLRLDMGIPMSEAFVHESTGTPIPAKGETLFKPISEKPPAEEVVEEEKPPTQQVSASQADVTWKRFPNNSGSLNIPRSEMPQISSGNRAALVGFLKARGIQSKSEEVKASSLKPTQQEYSPEKVKMAKEYQGGNRSILISQDNHVVDGHHQWLAAGDGPIKVIRLMAPITRILMMVHRMPSTSVAASIREDYDHDANADLESLVENIGQGLTGVARKWLGPIKPSLMRLIKLAQDGRVSDADFAAELEKMQRSAPDLMGMLDADSLEESIMQAVSTAALLGSTE